MAGLAVAKALAVAAGATLATRAAERGGGAAARDACAVAMLGLLFLARHLLPVRPILVTLLCLAAFLLVLEAMRVGAARRGALIALPAAAADLGELSGARAARPGAGRLLPDWRA